MGTKVKRIFRGFFELFGLQVSRITTPQGGARYFNTGALTPLQENSRELYDRFYRDSEALTEYYTEDRLTFYSAVSDETQKMGVLLKNKDILDLGCGTGHMLSALRGWSQPRSTSGCDFSDAAMQHSRKHFPQHRFFTHDIYNALPESYDVIICTEVLEHLERPFLAIRNMLTATRSGGAIVLTVPNGRIDISTEHINFWSPESWKVFLERECPQCVVKTSTLLDGKNNFALVQKPTGESG